ncbi:neuropeptide F [Cotesia typhae]|uniref:neuropeptide F n=1 Tax=Cotesia typhae TaxID=2053667 RepID=UPI003D683E74
MNRIMRLSENIGSTLALIVLTTWIFGSGVTCDEPETMSRPTRPKMLGSSDELRKFLDVVRDYYTVSSKARYGKRGVIPTIIVHDRPHTRVIINSLMKTLESVKDKHREREKVFKIEKTADTGHKIYHDNRVKQENKKNINIHTRVLFNSLLRRWLYHFKN